MLRKFLGVFIFCIPAMSPIAAQQADTTVTRYIASAVELDSVVIVATRSGFDIEDFIRLVQQDKSLYQAFSNLRSTPHKFHTQMTFLDRKGLISATYSSNNVQTYIERCRELTVSDQKATGKFFKGRKRKYKFYTAQLYDRVFITHGKVCSPDAVPENAAGNHKTEEHISELKKLIFTPGRQANVPLIGRKTEIFSEKLLPYYAFHIRSRTVRGIPVYEFEASVKKEFQHREGATVFKRLVTQFAKSDFQVVGRNYHLAHRNVLYMFDVTMEVELNRYNGKYFPTRVKYDGAWNVPGRKKEDGSFEVRLTDFQ